MSSRIKEVYRSTRLTHSADPKVLGNCGCRICVIVQLWTATAAWTHRILCAVLQDMKPPEQWKTNIFSVATSAKSDLCFFKHNLSWAKTKSPKYFLFYSCFTLTLVEVPPGPVTWTMSMCLLKSWPRSGSQAGVSLQPFCPASHVAEVTVPASIYWVDSHFSAYKYWEVRLWGAGDAFGQQLVGGIWHATFAHCDSDSKVWKYWIINYIWLQGDKAKKFLWSIFKLNIWTGGSWGLSYFSCIRAVISLKSSVWLEEIHFEECLY